MIVFRDVGLTYRKPTLISPHIRVLRDVTMVIPDHSRIALLGAAGSGKTTLLRLMCGSLLPSEGNVKRIGRVSFPLGFSGGSGRLSIAQYVQFVARCYSLNARDLLRRVVEFAELDDVVERATISLEPERRAQLNFALGYLMPFEHYLFDGRISVGNPDFRRKCLERFREKQKSAGIALAVREIDLAKEYCTSAAVLWNDGVFYFPDIDRGIDFYLDVNASLGHRTPEAHYVA
jgi:capsular polysaccharide transport system ATP-binding protein